MIQRIQENKIFNVTPPVGGDSVNINKWIEFRKNLEDQLNYVPIKWDLILLDNFLKLYPPDKTLEKFKNYLETQENGELSKKTDEVSNET
ncbi:15106_t:CDS:2 [Dentiscutata erythropus]|uniref:15106_t:CDS:1 n=1 Tax=Dentiscutata erythropus TaxID=1348616 RepID=A0A9N9GRW7_9GLOM|nr:15106_t:CDS:2 [Dentiscutata erythropus]